MPVFFTALFDRIYPASDDNLFAFELKQVLRIKTFKVC